MLSILDVFLVGILCQEIRVSLVDRVEQTPEQR